MSDTDRHQRAFDLFAQACELDPSDQAAFLDRACDDSALRHEVLGLLQLDEGADAPDDRAPLIPSPVQDAGLPERIGRYEILRRTGEGGMGTVYEARQDATGRRVAVKVLRTWYGSGQMLKRFERESQILARLQHPCIAQVLDAGTFSPDGRPGRTLPYFAMEFIDGTPLLEHARSRGLSAGARVDLMIRVCDAVAHAHERGVIHRDLKPGNILVTNDGDAGQAGTPKILDFGVARITDADVQATTMQTDVGQLIGTLAYMSPEQVAGRPEAVDERADVFALGVLLYELLAGSRPLDISGKQLHEAIRIIQEDEPTMLRSVDRSFRGDLDTIVRRAIEKDPAHRYASAAALRDDLQRFRSDEPIDARPPSAIYQFRKLAKRNRALFIGTGATFVALLLGLIGTTTFALDAASKSRAARWLAYESSITAASAAHAGESPATAIASLENAPPEHRDWEWRYLRAQTRPFTALLDEPVRGVAFWADRGELLALREDGTVLRCDPSTGGVLDSWPTDPPATEIDVAVRDGRVVLGTAQTVQIVDAATGGVQHRFDLPDGAAGAGASKGAEFIGVPSSSADGSRVLRAARDVLYVWDGVTGAELHRIERPGVHLGSILPDGARVAAVGWTRTRMIDLATGASSVQRQPERASAAAVSPDGRWLAVGTRHRSIFISETATGTETRSLRGHSARIAALAFNPDGTLVSMAGDGEVRLWDVESGACLACAKRPDASGSTATLCPVGDRRVVIGCGRRQGTVLWSPNEPAHTTLAHDTYVYRLAWSPDGRFLATAEFRGAIRVWSTADWRCLAVLEEKAAGNQGLAFSADGTELLSPLVRKNRVARWRTSDWSALDPIPLGEMRAALGAGSHRLSESTVLTAGGDVLQRPSGSNGTYIDKTGFGRFRDGERLETSGLTINGICHGLDVNERDTRFLTSSTAGVDLWDSRSLRKVGTLAHRVTVYGVAFSPGDTRLVTGGADGVIRFWSASTQDPVFELAAHDAYVHDLRFSPDGRRLASASGDATVKIWLAPGE